MFDEEDDELVDAAGISTTAATPNSALATRYTDGGSAFLFDAFVSRAPTNRPRSLLKSFLNCRRHSHSCSYENASSRCSPRAKRCKHTIAKKKTYPKSELVFMIQFKSARRRAREGNKKLFLFHEPQADELAQEQTQRHVESIELDFDPTHASSLHHRSAAQRSHLDSTTKFAFR